MSTTACTQPGCSGTITDGYCDVCGMPGAAAADAGGSAGGAPAAASGAFPTPATPRGVQPTPVTPPSPAPTPTPAAAVPNGTPCAQSGCGGTILDGYCDQCGTPAGGPPVQEAAPQDDGGSPGSTRTGSHRLDSMALGSKRIEGSGSEATHRTRSGSSRTRAARLGAGLTSVPPAPPVDPAGVVKTNPEVPEGKRYCSKCLAPVGRSQGDRAGRQEGFCAKCGTPYSFTPKLKSGDLVAGQYLVAGALAHGGLGWIYLARDRNVSDRWVVLKGLLNSGDPDALAAAIAEQRFLAQVEHPLIVEIYNFVTHEDAGYIVMEYVGGHSLKDVLKDRMAANNGAYDPLPVDQALAYIIEILPAFQYLHDLGLVYCDFKPDNLIQVGDAVKLIDLGGVRRIDDEDSAIYGTKGYQAPEVAEVGPQVQSDIYTIGRTMVVMTMEFKGYQGTYLHSLPDPSTTPVFAEHDSFYHLVAKCCAPDRNDRFQSADELREQALGVLREVVAARTAGTALTSAASGHFTSPSASTAELTWSQLPELKPDPDDPQHAWLSSLAPGSPRDRLLELGQAPEATAEVWLARGMEHLRLGESDRAEQCSGEMLKSDPWEWRALWISGLAALQARNHQKAQAAFNAVYQQVPGELAPKLALAVACEYGNQPEVAEALYRTCALTDAAYVASAAFGMARIRRARHETGSAVEALDMVPSTSRGFVEARRLRAEALLESPQPTLAVLGQALTSLDGVRIDVIDRARLSARILERSIDALRGGDRSAPRVGAVEANEPSLRTALEKEYRVLAKEIDDRAERIRLVNRANEVRPWSMT